MERQVGKRIRADHPGKEGAGPECRALDLPVALRSDPQLWTWSRMQAVEFRDERG